MNNLSNEVVQRIRRLGIQCDDAVPNDRLVSATAALACVPMYMVSNVHGWTTEKQFKVLDIEGSEAVREAYVIGQQKVDMRLDPPHDKVLRGFTGKDHPADRIIYEHALETLQKLLEEAQPDLAERVRASVARMIVEVAKASGKGLFGSGQKVSPEERTCIQHIAEVLALGESSAASAALAELG